MLPLAEGQDGLDTPFLCRVRRSRRAGPHLSRPGARPPGGGQALVRALRHRLRYHERSAPEGVRDVHRRRDEGPQGLLHHHRPAGPAAHRRRIAGSGPRRPQTPDLHRLRTQHGPAVLHLQAPGTDPHPAAGRERGTHPRQTASEEVREGCPVLRPCRRVPGPRVRDLLLRGRSERPGAARRLRLRHG